MMDIIISFKVYDYRWLVKYMIDHILFTVRITDQPINRD
jgi:hypothetical protein